MIVFELWFYAGEYSQIKNRKDLTNRQLLPTSNWQSGFENTSQSFVLTVCQEIEYTPGAFIVWR